MATSQNGWGVSTNAPSAKLQWITGRVRPGEVHTVFDYLCKRFNAEVEKIKPNWSWGWAYRPIRGSSSGYSNHASATAIDLNAPAHPIGVRNTFSPNQRKRIRKILSDLDGVIRWGGDYSGRPDDMHFEVNKSQAAVKQLASKINRGLLPQPGVANYKPKPVPVNIAKLREQFQIAVGTRKGKVSRSNDVARIQQALNGAYKAGLKVDGICGKSTLEAWKKHETKVGGKDYKRVPDQVSLRPLGKGRFNWYWPKK